jgi:MinD-like ATPase involved in chromosome partitioning or flagellar assembly
VNEFASVKSEGAGMSFLDFARELDSRFPEGRAAAGRLSALRPRVVVNMGKSAADAELCHRLRAIAAKNLGLGVEFSGYLLDDPALPASIAARRPLLDIDPDSPFSRGVSALASALASRPASAPPVLHDGDDDIAALLRSGS